MPREFSNGASITTLRSIGHADGSGQYQLHLDSGEWPSDWDLIEEYVGTGKVARVRRVTDRERDIHFSKAVD